MKDFALKYLWVLLVLFVGFFGGVFYTKRNHVSQATFDICQTDLSDIMKETEQCRAKFERCVYYVNGVLEVCKGVAK